MFKLFEKKENVALDKELIGNYLSKRVGILYSLYITGDNGGSNVNLLGSRTVQLFLEMESMN